MWLLLVSAVVGLLVAAILALAPNAILTEPGFSAGKAPLAIRAWDVTWVRFSVFTLLLTA